MNRFPFPATAPRPFVCVLALGALCLLSACGTGVRRDAGAAVEQRAVERWEYLIAHEAEKAYDYLTPGYRETITREAYAAAMNHRPVRWTDVSSIGRDCKDDRCTVTLNVRYTLKMAGMGSPITSESPQAETWMRIRGTWYFLPSD